MHQYKYHFPFTLRLQPRHLIPPSGDLRTSMATLVGGVTALKSDGSNSIEAEELARFAVADHNKKQNALLEFSKVTDAKQQVVAGTVYFLTIEVVEGGKKAMYEAKVWVKPWMDFKEVQEFKPIPPSQ